MRIFVFAGLLALALAKKTFFGDQVLTLQIENEAQAKVIRDMENEIDFWHPGSANQVRPGVSADVRINSVMLPAFKTLMRRNKISFEVKIDDLQKSIDAQMDSRERGILDGNNGAYDYNVYHTYEEINQWTKDMEAEYPSLVQRSVVGESFEGRDIPMLKLSTSDNNPAMLIDCGIHAREWISPAFCQCYVNRLLTTEISKLNDITYYVIPSLNVDGYAFTHTNDRMWRKTRSTQKGILCVGADPNRNFNAGFGGEGSSSTPCSDTYHGPYPESEPAVAALANFIREHLGSLKMYVTFHSYGQMILYPYSYKLDVPPNEKQLDSWAAKGAAAIQSVNRKEYIYGPGATTIYLAAGGSDDYAYDAGVLLSYTVELRDKGFHGFTLPESQISAVCDETAAMMTVMHQAVLDDV